MAPVEYAVRASSTRDMRTRAEGSRRLPRQHLTLVAFTALLPSSPQRWSRVPTFQGRWAPELGQARGALVIM
jgi:hypothetical protein